MISERCARYGHGKLKFLRSSIRSDIRRFMTKSPDNLAAPDDLVHRVSAFFTPEILAQATYRTAHFLHVNGYRRIATLLTRVNSFVHKINIPPHSCIGPGLHIPHPCGITFCGSAGESLTLYSLATCEADSDYADGPLDRSPMLGDRVISGAHQAIMGPVRVGDDVVMGIACSKISEDIPSNMLIYPRQRIISHARIRRHSHV